MTKKSPFIPCKQSHTAAYTLKDQIDITNFAKYHRKEKIDRKHHAEEDLSYQLSPFRNRISLNDSYISQLGYKALN